MRKLGLYFNGMVADIQANATAHGYLGGSTYLGAEASSNNTILMVMYFRDPAAVHAYANGPMHREAWNWYYKEVGAKGSFAIWHELYHVPKGRWEAVYAGARPLGLASASVRVQGKDGEGEVWRSTAVDASRGILKSSRGRMAGVEGEQYLDLVEEV